MGTKTEVALILREKHPRPKPDPEKVRRAANLLVSAKKPFIWAGGGVILGDASPEMVELAEALGAAVATTPEGKGAMAEDHPLALGGGYYGFGAARWAMPQADVILAVGTRFSEVMRPFTALKPHQKLIHVDADPLVIGKSYPAEIAIIAHTKAALKALVEEVRKKKSLVTAREPWPQVELMDFRERHRIWLREKAPLQTAIINTLRKELSDDAILVAGVTNIGYWCHLAYQAKRPRTYLTSSYFATLGYSFPTALGAKVAAPDKQVVSVVGDGGFMYALAELATAVRYGINLITVVFTDNAFGSTKSDQQVNFQGRIFGTELNNPDFARLAELFGAKGLKAEPEHLGKALAEALAAQKPTVIEVPIPTLIPPFQIFPRAD
jgi:acetolactate synthase-1/2/3 large subunit